MVKCFLFLRYHQGLGLHHSICNIIFLKSALAYTICIIHVPVCAIKKQLLQCCLSIWIILHYPVASGRCWINLEPGCHHFHPFPLIVDLVKLLFIFLPLWYFPLVHYINAEIHQNQWYSLGSWSTFWYVPFIVCIGCGVNAPLF
jgi:hypothetical protein